MNWNNGLILPRYDTISDASQSQTSILLSNYVKASSNLVLRKLWIPRKCALGYSYVKTIRRCKVYMKWGGYTELNTLRKFQWYWLKESASYYFGVKGHVAIFFLGTTHQFLITDLNNKPQFWSKSKNSKINNSAICCAKRVDHIHHNRKV